MDNAIQHQLEELLILSVEGIISADQVKTLNRLIKDNPERIRFTVRYLRLISLLKQSEKETSVLSTEDVLEDDSQEAFMESLRQMAKAEQEAPVIPQSFHAPQVAQPQAFVIQQALPYKRSRTALYTTVILSAAMFMLLAYVLLMPPRSTPVMAYLSRSVHAQWANASGPLKEDMSLYAGPMKLTGGLAEITMECGATIIVEAPTEFDLENPSRVYLKTGSMTINISNSREDRFIVRTQTATIVDFGTEFGVNIDNQGMTRTHVFQGQVELRSGSDPFKFSKAITLLAGQGGQSDSAGKLTEVAVESHHFVRQEQFETEILSEKGSSYHRWKAYNYKLHTDPSLVAHYTFEKDSSSADILVNSAPATLNKLNGILDCEDNAPDWVKGCWPEKTALRFERGKNQRVVIGPDSAMSINGPLSISVWVSFPDATKMGGHLISCREDYNVNYQFSLFDELYQVTDQRQRFELLRFDSKNQQGFYSRPFIPKAGVWYHFTLTHDTQTVRIYINGELFESKDYKAVLPYKETEIILGSMKKGGQYTMTSGDFDGIVDELMIFNRCLNPEEIKHLYDVKNLNSQTTVRAN